jgi:hypothetical protein
MKTDRTSITSLAVAACLEARLEGMAHRTTATAIPDKGSVFSHELLNLAYDTIEFVDKI